MQKQDGGAQRLHEPTVLFLCRHDLCAPSVWTEQITLLLPVNFALLYLERDCSKELFREVGLQKGKDLEL